MRGDSVLGHNFCCICARIGAMIDKDIEAFLNNIERKYWRFEITK